ncbi:MAG: type II secretion system protein [Phycisphaeraceae bacterium]
MLNPNTTIKLAQRNHRRAYTLIEMLVAAGILAFGLILLSALFPVGGIARKNAADDTFANTHARNVLAVLQAMGQTQVLDRSGVTTPLAGFEPLVVEIDPTDEPLRNANSLIPSDRRETLFALPIIPSPSDPWLYQVQTDTRSLTRGATNTDTIIAHYPFIDSYRIVANTLGNARFDNRYPLAPDAPDPTYDHRLLLRRTTTNAPIEAAVFVFRREDARDPNALVLNDFNNNSEVDPDPFGPVNITGAFQDTLDFEDTVANIGELAADETYQLEFPTGGIRNHSILMVANTAGNPAYITRIVGSTDREDNLVALLGADRPPAIDDPFGTPAVIDYNIFWLPARTATIVTGLIP